MKRIYFFATPTDIVPVLGRIEAAAPLKFVVAANLTTPNPVIYSTASGIPEPGVSTHETGALSRQLLVSFRDAKTHLRTFVGERGEKRWMTDNGFNEETVALTMAGRWGEDILLPGNMSTLHDTAAAQQLMKGFRDALKREGFVQVKRFWWLGREAMEMLRAGKRLTTTAVQSPPEYDLTLG